MEHAVCFERPSWLRRHHVDSLAPGNATRPIPQRRGAQFVDVPGIADVKQGVRVGDRNRLRDPCDRKCDGYLLRKLRVNLDQEVVGPKPRLLESEMVGSEWQLFRHVLACGIGIEGQFEMSGLADQQAVRRRQGGAIGICDGETKFTGVILSAR